MKPLTIPIFVNNDLTSTDEKLGMNKTTLKDCDLRPYTFHSVSVVSDYTEEETGVLCARIFSGGDAFVTPLTREEVNELIEGVISSSLMSRMNMYSKRYEDFSKRNRISWVEETI